MTNTVKLNDVIRSSGVNESVLADRLGISVQDFETKANGQAEFTSGDISILADVLRLSGSDIDEIFFPGESELILDGEI